MSLRNNNHKPKAKQQCGFTVVEVLVAAPLVVLIIGAFIGLIINITGDVLATRAASVLAYNIQDTLDRIERDVKLSGAYLATNNVNLTSPQGFDNGTGSFQNAGSNGPMLILNAYSTTDNPISTDTGFVYLNGQPNACNSGKIVENPILMFNIVYFVRDNSLWRRVLMPENYNTIGCSTPWQQPSCAPGITGAYCVTQDMKLVDGITANGFNITYFTDPSETQQNTIASDSGASTADRSLALQAATTARITIDAEKTVAGRTFGQSGATRAISTNDNPSATTLENFAPLITTQPQNKTVLASDTNIAAFTVSILGYPAPSIQWQSSPDYGGTWNDVLGATSTTLTLPTVTDIMDGDLYRAVVANSKGSVTSSSAMLMVNNLGWQALTLQNNWTTYDSVFNSAAYMKTSSGTIVLKGLVKRSGTPVLAETIASLPEGYRPTQTHIYQNTSNSASGRVDVYASGSIAFIAGGTAWYSLDGISFIPEGGRYSRTAATPLSNGWTEYSPTSIYGTSSYVVDSVGRVDLQGLLTPGTGANGTQIYNVPLSLLPPLYLHISARSAGMSYLGVEHRVGVTPTGIVSKGTSSSYQSMKLLYYPAGIGSWTNLTLQNGWVWYGDIFSTPQYTKASDGLVSLKGLIKSGTATDGTVLAVLPVGYRPANRLLLTSVAAGVWARIDITNVGQVIIQGGGNSGWTSLDGINFYADQ